MPIGPGDEDYDRGMDTTKLQGENRPPTPASPFNTNSTYRDR
jgi:hypothetical protein